MSFLACEFSPSKIQLADYPKSLISRINEIYVFFNKILLWRYFIEKIITSFIIVCFAAIKIVIVKMVFCDVRVTLYNVSVMLSPALTNQIIDVHPRSDSMGFRRIGRGSSH